MRIYNLISIIYLKFIINPVNNSYLRRYSLSLVIIIDEKKKYQIKRLLRKKRIRRDRN